MSNAKPELFKELKYSDINIVFEAEMKTDPTNLISEIELDLCWLSSKPPPQPIKLVLASIG